MSPTIEIRRLSKVFRRRKSLREILSRPAARAAETWALRDVGFSAPPGSITGVLGPNGAGKTTLLKILAGLVLPTSGGVQVAGFDLESDSYSVKRSLGFVSSDERSFLWRLTGRENLQFFGSLYSLSGKKLAGRIAFLLERLELEEPADRPFKEYSSGMKQRLSVARALLHDPPVLLLDEPTRSLDPITAKHLRRFLAEELNRRGGKTLLWATHNLQEAEQICDRVAILSRGRLLSSGRVEELPVRDGGRDAYVLVLSGMRELPEGVRDGLEVTEIPGGRLRVAGEFARDGVSLSALLREVLARNGRVVSCSRVEPTLQEIFDEMEEGNA